MNVMSTASVLPHLPADINDMLSVVFFGAGKLVVKSLQNMFRVRKKKVQELLLWLKNHNHLYANMPLDFSVLDLYPDDGLLPGMQNCVVQDTEIYSEKVFFRRNSWVLRSLCTIISI